MTNFEKACLMSCEDWVNKISEDYSHQKQFVFSKSFEKNMDTLIDKMRNNKYHRLTRKSMRVLIVAAILLSFATTAFAIPTTREYIIKQFQDHFSYWVTDVDEIDLTEDISIGYVPDGFIKTDEDYSEIGIYCEYTNNSAWFSILKHPIDIAINYDNNKQEIENINNIDYVIASMNDTQIIVWNNGQYSYRIVGNIDKSILITIAEKTK